MSDLWMIRGAEYSNCICAWGCPCQFGAPSTSGRCEAIAGGIIEEGHFGDIRLDGITFALLLQWPGEIADGNGRQQAIIDERADADQREAVRKILHGESTTPGATHFFVFNSTMSEVLETRFEPIEIEIDIPARKGRIVIPGIVDSTGSPIIDPINDVEFRAGIHLPNGFEYTYAEMGTGSSEVTGEIQMSLSESYGQFNILHMNQDGVIR